MGPCPKFGHVYDRPQVSPWTQLFSAAEFQARASACPLLRGGEKGSRVLAERMS